MNKVFRLLLLFLICSCVENSDVEINSCIENEQNDAWVTEDFKSEYTIQFPSNYEGNGMVGFEGNTFYKIRSDSLVELSYNYCSALYCEDFGDTLMNPKPNSVVAIDKQGNNVELTEQTLFCQDLEEAAVLYYNSNDEAVGKYYMKQGEYYLEALSTYYDKREQQEIENILKTVKNK